MIISNRTKEAFDNGYEIRDSGYDTKPIPKANQKSYYVRTDTKGLRMWFLLEKDYKREI